MIKLKCGFQAMHGGRRFSIKDNLALKSGPKLGSHKRVLLLWNFYPGSLLRPNQVIINGTQLPVGPKVMQRLIGKAAFPIM